MTKKEIFKDAADKKPQKSDAEIFLDGLEVPYEKLPDGTWKVHGNVNLRRMDLGKLPDLSNVVVEGNFDCAKNGLTSLKGSPRHVSGNFDCGNNQLKTLEGGPEFVGGDLICYTNDFENYEGAPQGFTAILSNHGIFESWDDVPEHMRYSPEKRAQLDKEAAEAAAAEDAILERQRSPALQRDLVVRPGPLVPRK